MPEVLLSLLFKLLPYIIAAIGVAAVYFGVKRKGVIQERERQEAKRVEEIKQVQISVNKAVSKDEEIDQKVRVEIEKVTKKDEPVAPVAPGSQFKF